MTMAQAETVMTPIETWEILMTINDTPEWNAIRARRHTIRARYGSAQAPIFALPTEIFDQIVLEAGWESLGPLSVVNHEFNRRLSPGTIPVLTIRKFLSEIEQKKPGFACYTCHKMLPPTSFAKRRLHGTTGKNGRCFFKRMCLDCADKFGHTKPGDGAKLAGGMIRCGICRQVHIEYCQKCLWCSNCYIKALAHVRDRKVIAVI